MLAVNVGGIFTSRIITDAVNGDIWEDYCINHLIPSMNPYPANNSILVMDNVKVHHNKLVQAAALRRGVVIVYTPPYYPNLSLAEYFGNGLKEKMKSNQVYGRDNVLSALQIFPYSLDEGWDGVLLRMGYRCMAGSRR